MRLFIPACGDRIVLSRDWTFDLIFEHRNIKFAKKLGLIDPEYKGWGMFDDPVPEENRAREYKRATVTLPAGTVLECDRVYVRTYNKSRVAEGDDYDSITWKVVGGKKSSGRFWSKLAATREIEYEMRHDSLYQDRVKVFKQVHES